MSARGILCIKPFPSFPSFQPSPQRAHTERHRTAPGERKEISGATAYSPCGVGRMMSPGQPTAASSTSWCIFFTDGEVGGRGASRCRDEEEDWLADGWDGRREQWLPALCAGVRCGVGAWVGWLSGLRVVRAHHSCPSPSACLLRASRLDATSTTSRRVVRGAVQPRSPPPPFSPRRENPALTPTHDGGAVQMDFQRRRGKKGSGAFAGSNYLTHTLFQFFGRFFFSPRLLVRAPNKPFFLVVVLSATTELSGVVVRNTL